MERQRVVDQVALRYDADEPGAIAVARRRSDVSSVLASARMPAADSTIWPVCASPSTCLSRKIRHGAAREDHLAKTMKTHGHASTVRRDSMNT